MTRKAHLKISKVSVDSLISSLMAQQLSGDFQLDDLKKKISATERRQTFVKSENV